MNHGTACKDCHGARHHRDVRNGDWLCNICHGSGLTDTNSPPPSDDRQLIGVPGTTERDVAAYRTDRQLADDLMAAKVVAHGKWIGSRLVMPRWINGEPDYSHD